MIKKIDVIGMQLNNNYTRDQICEAEKYFESPLMQTVEMVTAEMVLRAADDPFLREAIESLDLPVMASGDLYEALELPSRTRRKEAEEQRFADEFFKRMEQSKRSVFLLADDEAALEKFSSFLRERFPKLQTQAALVPDAGADPSMEEVVNRINGEAPDAVCSLLPSPLQEKVLQENRKKINAGLWLGLGGCSYGRGEKGGLGGLWRRKVLRAELKKRIRAYRGQEV